MKPSTRRRSIRKALDFEAVRQIAVSLPGVEERITNWGWSFRVRGKMLACQAIHRSAERDSLVVKIGLEDRERLLAAEPDKFYLTPHYVPYPSLLVRVPRMSRSGMRSVLQLARRFVARETDRDRSSPRKRKSSRK